MGFGGEPRVGVMGTTRRRFKARSRATRFVSVLAGACLLSCGLFAACGSDEGKKRVDPSGGAGGEATAGGASSQGLSANGGAAGSEPAGPPPPVPKRAAHPATPGRRMPGHRAPAPAPATHRQVQAPMRAAAIAASRTAASRAERWPPRWSARSRARRCGAGGVVPRDEPAARLAGRRAIVDGARLAQRL